MKLVCEFKIVNPVRCLLAVRSLYGFDLNEAKAYLSRQVELTEDSLSKLRNALEDNGQISIVDAVVEEGDVYPFADIPEFWTMHKKQLAEAEAWRDTLGKKEKRYITLLTSGGAIS